MQITFMGMVGGINVNEVGRVRGGKKGAQNNIRVLRGSVDSG